MTYVNARSSSVGMADRVAAMFKVVKESADRRQMYRRTVAELNALSDRDLADLGMARCDIAAAAHEATYLS